MGISRSSSRRGTLHGAVIVVVAVAASLSACKKDSGTRPAPITSADSQQQHIAEVVAAGGVVDSVLPIATQLERFRAGLTDRPDTLRRASASRDALVERWARALASADTSDLNAMLLDRAEFAWLYYPESAMSKPPYEAPPQLLWGQLLASSNGGAQQLVKKFGGHSFAVRSLKCPDAPTVEGENRLHQHCLVMVRAVGAPTTPTEFFGSIVERAGRFKFLGYANRQ